MVLVLWLGKQYVRNYTHLHDSNPSPSTKPTFHIKLIVDYLVTRVQSTSCRQQMQYRKSLQKEEQKKPPAWGKKHGCVYLLVESSSRSVADGFASRKQEENAHTYR